MTVSIRIALLAGAVSTFLYVFNGVKKARFKARETFFWLLLCFLFVMFAAFPGIADWCAGLLGFYAPVNLVYLLVIFLLLIKVFVMDRRAAKTEYQLTELIKKLAIDRLNEEEQQEGKEA